MSFRALLTASCLLLAALFPLRAQVLISEFSASKGTTLADEDGDYSDWIELYNAGNATVDLDGWYLTDDPGNLTQWRIPSAALLPKGYRVVFASGKNRANPAANLHTSFSLDGGGEFLALVQPNGKTIAFQFAPTYPPQERNITYGVAQAAITNTLVATSATGRYLVPTNSSLGTTWTQRSFVDTAWPAGQTPLGYETSVPGFAVRNVKASIALNDLATAESVLADPGLQADTASINSALVNFFGTGAEGHYGDSLNFPGHTTGIDVDDFVLEVTSTVTIPEAGPWTFGVNSDDGFSLQIGGFNLAFPDQRGPDDTLAVFDIPAPGEYPLRLVYYERSGGANLELFAARGSFAAWSTADFRLVGDTANGGLASRAVPIPGSTLGYRSLIATDIQADLKDVNASLYLRRPFTLAAPLPTSLTLRVRYDDGFVAYLNGTEVAQRNAPAPAAWNSAATAEHPVDQAVAFEEVNLSDRVNLLVPGSNVLAIHALNVTSDDDDFLLDAGLVSYQVTAVSTNYFATPTPGSLNSTSFVAFVADTRFTVDRGFFTQPFDLEIATTTAGASIYYTTNGTVPSPQNGFLYTAPLRIAGTTVLRASAHKAGYQPSNVDTQTYLFLEDVLRQSPDGSPPPGWPSSWGGNVVDYGMDPQIVNDPRWAATLKDDLKSLPSFSLVLDLKDLFDPTTGIYANPGQDGRQWERPCSVELLQPAGGDGFQINAGIRIRGGFSRSTSNPKHAFRLFFRSDYGRAQLHAPLFGDEGTDTFDAIDLRTFQNYSWSFGGDPSGVFLRDQMSRDLQLAMGHPAERGRFYHLYINGQYWGLYNTCERPEASYGETYIGGKKEDYDVIKVEAGPYTINATDGTMEAWTDLYNRAQAGLSSDAAYEFIQGHNPDGTPNPAYRNLVDVDNLIDYELIIMYGGNLDAPVSNFLGNSSPNNWYGLRNRTGQFGGFIFFAHDAEHTLLSVNEDRTGPFSAGTTSITKSSPQNLWQQMLANPEFRLRAADHIHRHFFNNGILTPGAVRTQLLARAAQIERAVVAESARWGDAKREPPLTRDNWQTELNRIVDQYLPQRTEIVLNQLRNDGAYPNVTAPAFNQHGGAIDPGFALSVTAPAGMIYYTLDGQDPRLHGGAVHPAARTYSGPVTLNRTTRVKARVLSNGTWSALNEADFTVIRTWRDLVITEVMYHPAGSTNLDADEFEFVELKNVSRETLDLSGVHFTSGINYSFPLGTELAPDQFALLVANPTAFASRYPTVPFFGGYTGRLNNAGETLALTHAAGQPIVTLTFGDQAPWPIAADGSGFSLVPALPNPGPDATNAANWRTSSAVGGSPGRDDPVANIPPIWITEVLTHTDPPLLDSIELHNPNPTRVDISHWLLTDDRNVPAKFRIPYPTILEPGAYHVFNEHDFNPHPGVAPSFNLSSYGEEAYLFSADAATNLTGYSDGFSFGAAANGVSFGRHTLSTGEAQYPPQSGNSLGAPNLPPKVGPVVINELQYHPDPGQTEFIELKNLASTNVPLYDLDFPTNHWRLSGIDFEFPDGATIPALGLALVVEGDPDLFRTRHAVPPSVPVFGPYAGLLQNNGETLTLLRPDHPDAITNGTTITFFVPYLAVDALRYAATTPWPTGASGTGNSIERLQPGTYGNDPINWRTSPGAPSPGLDNTGNRRPVVVTGPDLAEEGTVFPRTMLLAGYAQDDGQPATPGRLTTRWSQVGGPGVVAFEDPTRTNTLAAFPGIGTYQLRLTASDGQFESVADLVVTLSRTAEAATLSPPGAVWRYWDQGTFPGATWTDPNYSDAAWKSGPAQLGYSTTQPENDEATLVGYGPNAGSKYITTWFRRDFKVTNPSEVRSLTAFILRDDGAVAYLNGHEILRSNMPNDDILPSTLASEGVGGASESTFFIYAVDPALLVQGRNVLAVEIHQSSGSSSDISFDFELVGDVIPANQPPVVQAGPDQAIDLASVAHLAGAITDDGLPLTPGFFTATWSRVSGPGDVAFHPANLSSTTATFSAPGQYVLRLTGDDGTLTASEEVTINVTPPQESFQLWRVEQFSLDELADPSISGPDADPDADGHTNFQEYIAGTMPKNPQSVLRFESVSASVSPDAAVVLSFVAIAGKTYTLQYQEHFQPGTWQTLENRSANATTQTVQVLDTAPGRSRSYRIVTPALP